MPKRFSLAMGFVLLAAYAAFMISTNTRLSILDDEGIIVELANTPVRQTIGLFLHGTGQHEHPPLSDLFLHGWLILTHHSFAWLRIFANIFYLAGLLVLAKCGEVVGKRSTAWAVLLFGIAWPFGYFYARVTGWYCFCFLLTALLLYSYFLLLRSGTFRLWILFTLVACAFVWSNYYSVAILLILFFDMLVFHTGFAKKQARPLLLVGTVIALSFLPLIHPLLAGSGSTMSAGVSPVALVVEAGFMLFALLASVSVAPWFFAWSIPVGIAILALFAVLLTSRASRRMAGYFLALILGLGLTNHLDLKRLLFLTPLLILAVALCISASGKRRSIIALTATSLVFAFGWLGIATGSHPATVNFYDPWRAVTATTIRNARQDTAIVSDSVLYFFYLDSALGLNESTRSTYLGSATYLRRGMSVFFLEFPRGVSARSFSSVTTVQGVNNFSASQQELAATIQQLQRSCKQGATERYSPDPSATYKRMLDPRGSRGPVVDYRIVVSHFDCRNDADIVASR